MHKKNPEDNIYQFFIMDKMHQHALDLWKNCSGENFSGVNSQSKFHYGKSIRLKIKILWYKKRNQYLQARKKTAILYNW